MNTVHNPSGCMSIRIRRAHRPTLLQRLARAFAEFAAALAEIERAWSRA
ncbi:MAG: hypothetical protein RJA63_33 [Pseudomonadota bacterium]|jgi:hypothetical protein